jgi:putative copper export protein
MFLIIGLLLIMLSIGALAYAWLPKERQQERQELAPTWFVQPQSQLEEWRRG